VSGFHSFDQLESSKGCHVFFLSVLLKHRLFCDRPLVQDDQKPVSLKIKGVLPRPLQEIASPDLRDKAVWRREGFDGYCIALAVLHIGGWWMIF